jgi:dTDP-4-dehydrorhamnose reductase
MGLLGSNLVADLSARGIRTAAMAREELPNQPLVEWVRCDLTDACRLSELLERLQPACILHCAALTNVDWCESHPEIAASINVEISRNVASIASRMGSQFVYISTDSVFDGSSGGYTETDATEPVNVYAQTKLAGETAVLEALPQSLVVRTNIYGWNRQPKLSLAEWVLEKLESATAFPGFADVIFSPILVNDLGGCILELLERNVTGVYHVAAADACSKYEFSLRLAEVFGLDPALVQRASVEDAVFVARRPRNTSLNTSRVAQVLGRPMPTIIEGLRRFKSLRDSGYVARLKDVLCGVRNA